MLEVFISDIVDLSKTHSMTSWLLVATTIVLKRLIDDWSQFKNEKFTLLRPTNMPFKHDFVLSLKSLGWPPPTHSLGPCPKKPEGAIGKILPGGQSSKKGKYVKNNLHWWALVLNLKRLYFGVFQRYREKLTIYQTAKRFAGLSREPLGQWKASANLGKFEKTVFTLQGEGKWPAASWNLHLVVVIILCLLTG